MLIYPVFIPQQGCPFRCVYCNQTSFGSVKELPAQDLTEQIGAFCLAHQNEHKQIAFYGGTFTALSLAVRESYYQVVKPFFDDKTTLRVSTRPDAVGAEELDWCGEHKVRTIELGIQDFNDEVLAASCRGYDNKTAVEACLLVRQYGFELGVQLMPGLPCSAPASHLKSLEHLQQVQLDFLRIYPLIILSGTPLWDDYKAGKIQPLSLEEAIDICILYCEWARCNNVSIIKLGIPSLQKGLDYVGPYHPAFGELVKGEMLIREIEQFYEPGKTVHISSKDISLLTGHQDYNLRKLIQRTGLERRKIVADAALPQGEIRLADA